MPIPRSRTLTFLFSLILATLTIPAQGIPIGFEESYALAADRAAVVANLIPGTEDWYYYHCRERLDARDFDTVRTVLPTWIKRHGRTARVIEIENREALLSFDKDPERSYDHLRRRLGLSFNHQRVVPGARSNLASKLDPALLSPTSLTRRALRRHPGTVDGFNGGALAALCSTELDDKQLHSLLKRLDRPDAPNLPTLIVRDLGRRESRGFGSLPIHGLLRRGQLDECLALRPRLLQDSKFVSAYLTRMQPNADTAWFEDSTTRAEHLSNLWGFARRLNASFNSLKAHVLFHWLQHDLSQGAPDKERFLEYIRLPRRRYHAAKAHLDRHQKRAEHVDLKRTYPSLLPAIGRDDKLVLQCLEHFFQNEDSIDAYSDFLDSRWLEGVLAETKILRGDGDMERWYSLLNDPARLERLEKRVELTFPATMRKRYDAGEAVRIELDTKNVPTLLVKVFAIDSYRFHVERQQAVDASIELDGVVANHERTYKYEEPPARRVRRTFDLPMLRDPGTYVVEFVGNGISSRAVIHKGSLHVVSRTGAAGQMLRVYDEARRHQPTAIVWFGGREYTADERGEILLPFSTAPGQKQLVLRHGSRSSIVPFGHVAESYAISVGMHVDRESLIAGNEADLLLRPQLRLAGHLVSLQLLTQPLVTIVATDLDGLSTTQEVRDVQLVDGRELKHTLRVPNRLQSLQVTMSGQVNGIDGKPVALSSKTETFAFNQIDKGTATSFPSLIRTPAGYFVELRGKSGEVHAGRSCHLSLYHRHYRDPITVTLQTDATGRIHLGTLHNVGWIEARKEGGASGWFEIATANCQIPDVLHGRTGETLRLPYLGRNAAPTRGEFSLLGHNRDAFSHLAIADGFVELRDLEPGDYTLELHDLGQDVTVRITDGRPDDRYLVGRDRILQSSTTTPLHVRNVETDDDNLNIRLSNATTNTRVHVIATRYLPAFDVFRRLRGDSPIEPNAFDVERLASTYHAGRKLSDEFRYVLERRFAKKYPGNMLMRPSLLLNPMALQDESWNEAVGIGGGAGGRYGGRAGKRRKKSYARAGEEGRGSGAGGGQINLDYLLRGSTLLANLTPAADGTLSIPLARFGDKQHIHVLALDGPQAIYRSTTRAERQVQIRERTLPSALAADGHFIESREIEFLAAGGTVRIDGAQSARLEIHDSLAKVFRLFSTISKNGDLAQFAFLLDWPQMTREQKLDKYSRFACHELHFFVRMKDPEFFRTIVRPFLSNKLEKTFLDHWLLEADLSSYLEPWRFARLNTIEKILLAQRIGEDERSATGRSLHETLEIRPISDERLASLFSLALKSDELSNKSELYTGLKRVGPADTIPPPASAAAAQTPKLSTGRRGRGTRDREAAKDEKQSVSKKPRRAHLADEEAAESLDLDGVALEESLGAVDKRLEMEQRKQVRRLFRAVEKTKLLVEHNYWNRRFHQPTTDVVPVNHFWIDYATRDANRPFVSAAIAEATGSVLEMIMALAVLDLPFEAGEHEIVADATGRSLRAATPLLLVRKQIKKAQSADGGEPVLLGQNFFRLDDRYRIVDGQRRDAFVTDEFLVDVAYGCQVVVTNPTSSQRSVELLLQIPSGAVPLQAGFWTRGRAIQLAPYATQTVEYSFYFPKAGKHPHYPVHAGEGGKLLAFADARTLNVVDTPSQIDTSSWAHVSQQGSAQEVLAFLDANNLQRIDLTKIAWRMRERAFYQAVLQRLIQRHVYDPTLWSYAVLHRDASGTREYVRHRDDFLDQCGFCLESPLVSIDPRERLRFQQLELDPLVHQRAHRLGSQHRFGNRDLARQYTSLMSLLGYRPQLSSDDWLVVTYYLLLQNRIEDALGSFARIDRSRLAAQMQYDYLEAYMCFFTGDTQKARGIAMRHRDHAIPHWQKRFRTVIAHLDEAEGKSDDLPAEQTNDSLASTAPTLELAVEGKAIAVQYDNIAECEVRYYELDVEFAFSSQPFAGPDGASAAYVRPNHRETRSLPNGAAQLAFELPQQFWQKNVLVEVRAAGLVRSRQYFANALDVRFLESYGQVAVTEPASKKPLAKTYVKVFARLPNGQVRFHKDGYTDLRGRFDYASLSDDPNRGATRYAVLVLDERRGAVIREIAPPAQ